MLLGKKKVKDEDVTMDQIEKQEEKEFDTIDLPSGNGNVTIRRMKARDEDIIGDTSRAKNGKSLDDFVKSITGVEEDEYKNWPLGDKMFTLFEIRKLSKGTEYSLEVGCPFCDKMQEVDIDLNKLKIEKMKKDGLDDKLHYDLVLPYSGKKIKRKILKVRDEKDIRNGHFNHKDSIMSYLTMIQTVEMEGVKIKNLNIFKEMDSADVEFLIEKDNEYGCGVENDYTAECTNGTCLCEFKVQVPIDIDFFLRKKRRKSKKTAKEL